MRRLILAVSVAVGLLLPFTVGVIEAPTASSTPDVPFASCGGSPSPGFQGYYYSLEYETIGTYAQIVTRPANTCFTDYSQTPQSLAWEMIQGQSNYTYMQAGFIHRYGFPTDYFSEQNNGEVGQCDNGGSCVDWYGGTAANGGTGAYYQYYQPVGSLQCSAGCEQSYVNYQLEQQTSYNPYAAGEWQEPIANEYSAERNYSTSDIPGNTTDGYTTWTNMEWQGLGSTYSGGASFYGPAYATVPVAGNATKDGVVNHGGTEGNAFDAWCNAYCTP
jgi:hypothetical protein